MIEYFGAKGLDKYINEIKIYKLREKELLALDNNSFFEVVEGPHSMYYYPSENLVTTINTFIEK